MQAIVTHSPHIQIGSGLYEPEPCTPDIIGEDITEECTQQIQGIINHHAGSEEFACWFHCHLPQSHERCEVQSDPHDNDDTGVDADPVLEPRSTGPEEGEGFAEVGAAPVHRWRSDVLCRAAGVVRFFHWAFGFLEAHKTQLSVSSSSSVQ